MSNVILRKQDIWLTESMNTQICCWLNSVVNSKWLKIGNFWVRVLPIMSNLAIKNAESNTQSDSDYEPGWDEENLNTSKSEVEDSVSYTSIFQTLQNLL